MDARNTWRDHPSQFLIERFIEGRVFHVDSVVADGKVIAAGVSEYGAPPMRVSHEGGVFTTSIVPYKSKERKELEKLNKQLLKGFEYEHGVSHAEFLQSAATGEFYLLEVAARVGGAYIANVLEQAAALISGANGRSSKPRRRKIRTNRRNCAKITPESRWLWRKNKRPTLRITRTKKSSIA